MNPYVDISDNEISIHCLDKEDLMLLAQATRLLLKTIPIHQGKHFAKSRVLKNLLENESLQPRQRKEKTLKSR